MEKKLYNQPTMVVTAMMPTAIICASITPGGDADPETIGD